MEEKRSPGVIQCVQDTDTGLPMDASRTAYSNEPPSKRIILACDGTSEKPFNIYLHNSNYSFPPSTRSQTTPDADSSQGTWLNADNGLDRGQLPIPSNVTRILRALEAESASGIPQVAHYEAGVGSQGGPLTRAVGGATAEGISTNIRAGYDFIAQNYVPGDEIFLLGFSRGAFTARSVAGLIDNVGVLTRAGLPYLDVVFKDFENRADPSYASSYPNVPFPNKPSGSDPQYRKELQRVGRVDPEPAVDD